MLQALLALLAPPATRSAPNCACVCIPTIERGQPDSAIVREYRDSSSAVLLGRVTAINYEGTDPFGPLMLMTVEVKKAWKGVASSRVVISGGPLEMPCNRLLDTGKTYLIYANRNGPSDSLTIDDCSRILVAHSAKRDLRFLGKPLKRRRSQT